MRSWAACWSISTRQCFPFCSWAMQQINLRSIWLIRLALLNAILLKLHCSWNATGIRDWRMAMLGGNLCWIQNWLSEWTKRLDSIFLFSLIGDPDVVKKEMWIDWLIYNDVELLSIGSRVVKGISLEVEAAFITSTLVRSFKWDGILLFNQVVNNLPTDWCIPGFWPSKSWCHMDKRLKGSGQSFEMIWGCISLIIRISDSMNWWSILATFPYHKEEPKEGRFNLGTFNS